MHTDHYNLKCALIGFLMAGLVGFTLSSEIPLSDLVDCPPHAPHTAPHK